MVSLPYLHRIQVKNYGLYVGNSERPGLDHVFRPGVNVIVGINGLGKTTLLNILLRCISGPLDIPGGEELGDKKRTTAPSDRHWFRRRVPDDAVTATARAEFFIGNRFFAVERSLANMELRCLEIDHQEEPAINAAEREAKYHAAICDATQLARFDDFVFLLRYVVFFLEDRKSLVWDESAQGEILSILFGLDTDRRRYVEVFEELLSKDSEYRNTLHALNKWKARFEKSKSTLAGGQLDMLLKQLEETQKLCSSLTQQRREVEATRDSLRNQIENRQREIFDRRAVLSEKLDTFYQSFFPTLGDSARYLLSHFDSGTGCLVCGTSSNEAIARVKAKLTMNVCPACESPIETAEQPVHHDPYAGDHIEDERRELTEMEESIGNMSAELRKADREHAEILAKSISAVSDVEALKQQLHTLGETVPSVKAAMRETEDRIAVVQTGLDQIEIERLELAAEFRKIANEIDAKVKQLSPGIEAAFARYISGFLAEDCVISYTTRERRLGQRGKDTFSFPHFVPALTSGVYRHGETVRESATSVSESQREFIDLAFRMALLEAAAPNMSSMLVLETPEASLDSVFIPRAADLLRRFSCRTGGAANTRLIASSNVNREQMIPALFGAYPDEKFHEQVASEPLGTAPPTLPIEQREGHILDLLKIAAPTRALEKFRVPYEEERDKAIYPERFSNDTN